MKVRIAIWDTTSCELDDCISLYICRGAQAAIVVYDITNEDTFERARSWVERLQEIRPDVFVALVGNKADLASARMVKYEVIHVCCKVHVCQIL